MARHSVLMRGTQGTDTLSSNCAPLAGAFHLYFLHGCLRWGFRFFDPLGCSNRCNTSFPNTQQKFWRSGKFRLRGWSKLCPFQSWLSLIRTILKWRKSVCPLRPFQQRASAVFSVKSTLGNNACARPLKHLPSPFAGGRQKTKCP